MKLQGVIAMGMSACLSLLCACNATMASSKEALPDTDQRLTEVMALEEPNSGGNTLSAQWMSTGKTASAKKNPFVLDPSGQYHLYSYNASLLGYTEMGYAYWSAQGTKQKELDAAVKAINALPVLQKPTGLLKKSSTPYGLMSVSADGKYTKTEYTLNKDTLEAGGITYSISKQQYESLKKVMDPKEQTGATIPQWFVFMNPERVTSMQCTDKSGKMQQMPENNLLLSATELSFIHVKSAKQYKPGSKKLDQSPFKAVYTFDNGATYSLYIQDTTDKKTGVTMYVECSDLDYACEYKVDGYISSYIQTVQEMLTGHANPRTGKPVIYLYPQQKQDVSVQLRFEGDVTYTYPVYQSGWNVVASPDGTLLDKADQSTHYYLFWEGNAHKKDWDFSEGFVVAGADANRFLREKMIQLGLTPKEYNDFITYWAPELAQNPYNLVTFSTAEYEDIAKLEVTPKPDTVLRVHMVWKAIPVPVDLPEQILPKIPERKGFTVVEWGGTRA